VSVPEAARQLGISPRFLWGLTRAGKIECVRIGRRVLYDQEALRRFIASRSEGGQ
jgi:excisionase family DNA binding protein